MTLEQKVGQLFMTYFDGQEVNEEAARLIKEMHIGGIIYYNWANDLSDPKQVEQLSSGLQALADEHIGIPLLIAVDQEGGLVARLQGGFTEFPGNAALGRTEQSELAYEAAKAMGTEMRAVGINLNLAPVVDVNSNPLNPVIGVRSFGDNPELVATFGEASMKGYRSAGVIPCLKHFPGYGDVSVDTHKALPVVSKDLDELLQTELLPYRLLSSTAPAIMTAHILFTALDGKNCATLSPTILQGLLRNTLGYDGVLITDSLTMRGLLEGNEEVVIRAFEAGHDILLIGGRDLLNKTEEESGVDEILRFYHSLLDAVRSGRVTEERVDQSVERILALKQRLGSPQPTEEKHSQIAREIACRSVLPIKGDFPLDLADKDVLVVIPAIIATQIEATDLGRIGTVCTFEGLVPTDDDWKQITGLATQVDEIIFCSYNAWKTPKQLDLLNLLAGIKPTTCIAVRDPYDLELCPNAVAQLATYSPTSCSLQVAAEWIQGSLIPLTVSYSQAQHIGDKIWFNECANRTDQLTFWNVREEFPSIGIGHFIWPPEQYEGPFSNGRFHEVVVFMDKRGVSVPSWILEARHCPWTNRDAFYATFDSKQMAELRAFLVDTVPFQALYMLHRLGSAFTQMVNVTPVTDRQRLINQFYRVANTDLYILIDYLNFKHEGIDPKEQYKGQGWGLRQVLLQMGRTATPNDDFADTAEKLLRTRIANSPRPAIEEQWLGGWIHRLSTYRVPATSPSTARLLTLPHKSPEYGQTALSQCSEYSLGNREALNQA